MKEISEITAAVIDAGCFPSLAERMAEDCKKVYYHAPFESEFLDLHDCCIGDGLPTIERLDEFMHPDKVKEIDLWIFPDRGFTGHQLYLRSIGKAVWGSMEASDIELYRIRFIKLLDKLGLDHVQTIPIRGVTKLAEHLKTVKRKWVKIERFRANMETRFHIDYEHSARWLESIAVTFGGLKDYVRFVVQDEIVGTDEEPVLELGYDGLNVMGKFPAASFQGYEAKNESYLGSLRKYEELPEQVRAVNDAWAPWLEQQGYTNFTATEIRVKGDHSYYIDPTPRMPGQTGEQILETCSNLPEVILHGANGELLEAKYDYSFAAEATIHYTEHSCDVWKVLRVPEGVRRWTKLYQFCAADGLYHFPPSESDELGVVVGVGDTAEEAIDHLKENLDALQDEPVSADMSKFVELLNQIKDAEEQNVPFSDEPLPEASSLSDLLLGGS